MLSPGFSSCHGSGAGGPRGEPPGTVALMAHRHGGFLQSITEVTRRWLVGGWPLCMWSLGFPRRSSRVGTESSYPNMLTGPNLLWSSLFLLPKLIWKGKCLEVIPGHLEWETSPLKDDRFQGNTAQMSVKTEFSRLSF